MSDADSEAPFLAAMSREGFTESFTVVAHGLRAIGSGKTFRPDELTIRKYRRFEGVSDPDDMSIVYAIETRDGTRGTVVDAFGVYASPALADILRHADLAQRKAA